MTRLQSNLPVIQLIPKSSLSQVVSPYLPEYRTITFNSIMRITFTQNPFQVNASVLTNARRISRRNAASSKVIFKVQVVWFDLVLMSPKWNIAFSQHCQRFEFTEVYLSSLQVFPKSFHSSSTILRYVLLGRLTRPLPWDSVFHHHLTHGLKKFFVGDCVGPECHIDAAETNLELPVKVLLLHIVVQREHKRRTLSP